MWIATDQDGEKRLFENKPTRNGKVWTNVGESCNLDKFPFIDIPAFVQQQQWKDAPIQIKFEIKKK